MRERFAGHCSESCQAEAKRIRKKRQQELINGIEPIMDLQCQEYLTFSKAAILMGCTRQYVYKLVANGKLKASRLSSRMAFVRKSDIERMFDANPYKRVIPCGRTSNKPSVKKKPKEQAPTGGKEENEVLDYSSGEEVMALYKVKRSWLYTSAKRNQIPMCRIAGKNYYSKRHIEDCLGLTIDTSNISEWLTTNEIFEEFDMKPTAIHAYAYRHHIPTKKEYGITYYSKTHIAELRQMDMLADERYCTVNIIMFPIQEKTLVSSKFKPPDAELRFIYIKKLITNIYKASELI